MKQRAMAILTVSILFFAASSGGELVFSKQQIAEKNSFDDITKEIGEAVAKIKPALVRIHVVTVKYYNGREVKSESVGSGAIIDKGGYVITNHHVAGNAKRIVCTLSDKEEIEADLVSTDPLTDISVIKLRTKGKKEFALAEFGDSSRLKIGDRVLAMGSPLALSQSVTAGIVSNTEIVMPKLFWPLDKFMLEGEDVGSIVRWIGHDAQIFGGNSGGPLVNLKGEIVGINEIRLGLGGAIPGNLAREVAGKLIKFGKVSRSWFGLEIQPLLRHSGVERGVLVSGTIQGSPSEKAGFLPGDILVRLAGREVNVSFSEEIPIFNQFMMGLPVGEEVESVVRRQGRELILRMTSEERENVQAKKVELKQWGITASNISLLAAKEMRRGNQEGVLVTSIRPGGPCWEARPRISEDDVIIEVNGIAIKNMEQLLELTNKIMKEKIGPLPVEVAFDRKKERYLTVLKLDTEKEIQDHGFEVRRAWLPVAVQAAAGDVAERLGIEKLTGVRITQVFSSSSAERAGLKVGDLIISVDGETVRASSPEDVEILPAIIRQYKIGSTVELIILRGKEKINVAVELEESPRSAGEMKRYIDYNFDFKVRDIAFLDYAREGWEKDQKGVLVEAVNEGGWASLAKLCVGDLILAADGVPVPDVEGFEKVMKKIAVKKPESVLLQVQRGIHNLFIELETSW